MRLAAIDFQTGELKKLPNGRLIEADVEEEGVLLSRVDPAHRTGVFDGYDDVRDENNRVLKNVFEEGDTWFLTWDVLRKDEDGDYYFVDRHQRIIRTDEGAIASREVEDVLYRYSPIAYVAVYAGREGGFDVPIALVVTKNHAPLNADGLADFVNAELALWARPRVVRVQHEIPRTDGYRPDKNSEDLISGVHSSATWLYDTQTARYVATVDDDSQSMQESLS
ncbi:MAG: hypothetical protein R3A47_01620 [Polyangiales bacterium]